MADTSRSGRRKGKAMRKLSAVALVVALATGFAASARSQPPALNVGYVPNADFVPLFVAKEKGLFDKVGLNVTLSSVVNQHNVPAGLTSGSIDLGPMAVPTFLLAAVNGVDAVAVAGYLRNIGSDSQAWLMVRDGLPFTGASSLEGKRIGMPGLKSSFDVHFRVWLLNNKVPIEDVNLVEVNFPQMSGMLKTAQIDASIAVEPFKSEIVRSGSGRMAADFMSEVTKNDAGLIWISTKEWAKGHPKELQQFIAGLKLGVANVVADPSGAQEVEKKYLKFGSPLSTSDYDFALSAADIKFYENMMLRVGFLQKPIDIPSVMAP